MSDLPTLRLHHIGHAVRQIEAAAEMYVSRFGYKVQSSIIHDPLQTAFVQFFRLEDEPSFLELVAPDGPESKLSAVTRRGGGLHHLCYSAGLLEAEIERLELAGMKLIAEPKPAVAFAGRRICWLMGGDLVPVELVERIDDRDRCVPAQR